MQSKLVLHRETVRTLTDKEMGGINAMSGQTCHNTICCCNTTAPTGSQIQCCDPTDGCGSVHTC